MHHGKCQADPLPNVRDLRKRNFLRISENRDFSTMLLHKQQQSKLKCDRSELILNNAYRSHIIRLDIAIFALKSTAAMSRFLQRRVRFRLSDETRKSEISRQRNIIYALRAIPRRIVPTIRAKPGRTQVCRELSIAKKFFR